MRRAVVTGGSSGIGRAVVEGLVAEGAEVDVLDIAEPVADFPSGVRLHQVDVVKAQELLGAFDAILASGDPIDALVACGNNAADICAPGVCEAEVESLALCTGEK